MAQNPETIITNDFRRTLAKAGVYSFKISDAVTRGIPDVHFTSDRGVFIEVKRDSTKGTKRVRTWTALGLRGPQDQRIFEMQRRAPTSIGVFTNTLELDRPQLWMRCNTTDIKDPNYYVFLEGQAVYDWIIGTYRAKS